MKEQRGKRRYCARGCFAKTMETPVEPSSPSGRMRHRLCFTDRHSAIRAPKSSQARAGVFQRFLGLARWHEINAAIIDVETCACGSGTGRRNIPPIRRRRCAPWPFECVGDDRGSFGNYFIHPIALLFYSKGLSQTLSNTFSVERGGLPLALRSQQSKEITRGITATAKKCAVANMRIVFFVAIRQYC
jgi:hypothetical protein